MLGEQLVTLPPKNHYEQSGSSSNVTCRNAHEEVDCKLEGPLALSEIQNLSEQQSSECEFCCLTLRSYTALKQHWKLHTEIPSSCYLCEPPFPLHTTEEFLEHIHAVHTSKTDSNKRDKYSNARCNFCDFPVPQGRVMVHLLTDCYMAPCPLCGQKLVRKKERVGHRKSHGIVMNRFVCECRRGFPTFALFSEHLCRNKSICNVTCDSCNSKFSGQVKLRSKILDAGINHYIESHTSNGSCLACETEPLVALREHILVHLIESSEVITPKPTLSGCSQRELFKDSFQEYLTPRAPKGKKRKWSCSRQSENGEFTEPSNSSTAVSTPLENAGGEVLEICALQSEEFRYVESSNSRDGTSPSLLERQRQVLADLIDDLGPPPSVIVVKNEAAVMREEREETPNFVSKSSLMDDGEDEILIIDDISKHVSSSTSIAPVVHTVNKGDDECMMLNVTELPTGAVSHAIAATREKKFKCSMCSEAFLRKSNCLHHEQNSHRNDIVSDLCNEIYGVPLDEESLMYICQQCAVAFEDPQRARRHLLQHMIKGPAFSCEKCSRICFTKSNLREHHKKHESGKLSYRCLKCTPNKTFRNEAAIYYHLHVDHGIPFIAFCKRCLLGSANMDRIFAHVVNYECSGGKRWNPPVTVQTLSRLLGFAVASDLYFQPNDEVRHKQIESTKGRFAIPTQCSHRSFIEFGEAFTTCPEDPMRCFALVNQNRWHSYLCTTNRDAPGEMPSVLPETVVGDSCAGNMIDILCSRFKANKKNSKRFPEICSDSPSTSSSNTTAVAPITQYLSLDPKSQSSASCSTMTTQPSHSALIQSGTDIGISVPLNAGPQQVNVDTSGGEISSLHKSQNNASSACPQSQSVCIFCRCRNVPMVYETVERAYEAVNELCVKFRDVHPIAAQILLSSLNSFIRDTESRRLENYFFCFCRYHYHPHSFDMSGRVGSSLLPSQINAQVLIENHQKGLIHPDPYCIAILAPVAVPSSVTPCAFSAPVYPVSVQNFFCLLPAVCKPFIQPPIVQSCIVCDKLLSSGLNAMNIEYMISMPLNPVALREQWTTNICRHLNDPLSQRLRNALRVQEQPRLCLRHFNPRSVAMNSSGAIIISTSAPNDLPVLNFPQYADLSSEFGQAFGKLLDAMEKNQNPNTIRIMLKTVQELVKCNDEKCGRPLNSISDIGLHRFHQSHHKFACTDCFSAVAVIHDEQEMIEHFVLNHFKRSSEEANVPVIYALHCPLKNCGAVYPSIQAFRKHINHAHSGLFPLASDNCATRFFSMDKMSSHNEIHEKHSCDVTCCYLCGITDPWQREIAGGVRISHELVHAMTRFVVCKTCMAPMGGDHTGFVLIDHFIRMHMVDQANHFRRCKICRKNIMEPGIAEHILELHKLIAFRPRITPQSNGITAVNGSEFCSYLGIPIDACNLMQLDDSSEL